MKKIFALLLILALLGGCAAQPTAPPESEAPTPSSEPETFSDPESEPFSEPDVYEPTPYEYTWQPYVYSSVFREVHGEETEQAFYAMVDAVLSGAETFPCPSADTLHTLLMISQTCFPPFPYLVDSFDWSDGQGYLYYAGDEQARQDILVYFQVSVWDIIVSAQLAEGDDEVTKAISLYSTYSARVTYDYAAAEDNITVPDVSSYRALTEDIGICQSFASAYAYLCLQCGVDAIPTGGMSDTQAHEWTLLKLDGEYYYADPTFENGDGGVGLCYFGMTAEKREQAGGFYADNYNIGNTNLLFGRDIDVTDTRFAPLWEAVYLQGIYREETQTRIVYLLNTGEEHEFIIPK
ncbi:MAG: hypothetical protein LBM28_00640 [Oscillospiraceae bacterium]|jgi:hypothetical protein|nr:hypothetical protein [Oscillospiraceae bacterium]